MSNKKKTSKINIGISTSLPSVQDSKIQPWPKKPSVLPHQLQYHLLIYILVNIAPATASHTTTNWNQSEPCPIGKDIALLPSKYWPHLRGRIDNLGGPFDLKHPPDPPYNNLTSSFNPTEQVLMSGRRGKREKSSSPAKRAGARTFDEDGDDILNSPPKHSAKRMFTGAKAMDEDFDPVAERDVNSTDGEATAGAEQTDDGAEETKEDKTMDGDDSDGFVMDERTRRKLERQKRIEEQKKTGRKIKTSKKKEKEAAKAKAAAESVEEEEPRGREKWMKKPTARSRSGSVPTRRRRSGSRPRRGTSVDSASSNRSKESKKSASSVGSASTSKTTKTAKSAAFAEGIPDNEGKTASTRKAAKDKKKASYAEKAKVPKRVTWPHSKIIQFSTSIGAVTSTPKAVYDKLRAAFAKIQEFDPEAAIQDRFNPHREPIRSPGEFPELNNHAKYVRHFTCDDEKDWTWDDNIKASNPRRFIGSFILLSLKDAETIFHHQFVDIRRAFGGEIRIKRIQEMETILSKVVFGVHGNCNEENVAIDLRRHLMMAESHLLERRKKFVNEGIGNRDTAFDAVDPMWTKLLFPPIYGFRGFPKGGAYEKTDRGQDVSWKHAIHFEWGEKDAERIEIALAEFKRRGGVAELFGSQAALLDVPKDDAGYLAEYRQKVPKHQMTNRSVGNVVVPGIINLDKEVLMTFTDQEGVAKPMTLRKIVARTYVKVGDRRLPAFLYAFAMRNGRHQLWFWDKVPEIKEFIQSIGANIPAYLWHRCKSWGWKEKPMTKLFQSSFDSETAIVAMNSKWSKKKQKVVAVELAGEAAELLNFGTSPFILAEGEKMKQRSKPVINASDLRGKIGGIDLDDMKSVSGQSCAQTVFQGEGDEESDESSDEEEEDYDDDVSAMGENEGFEDEATVGGEDGEDKSDEDSAEDDADEDSAFATKADLDELKKKGKKVRGEDGSADARIRQLELEKKMMEDMMNKKLAEMQAAFEQQKAEMEQKLAGMAVNENKTSGSPGSGAGADGSGGEHSHDAVGKGASTKPP